MFIFFYVKFMLKKFGSQYNTISGRNYYSIQFFAQKMAFNLDSSPEVSEKISLAPQLTQEQLDRIETNRKRALDIKKSKENAAKM